MGIGIEPRTLRLWGNKANHCVTTTPIQKLQCCLGYSRSSNTNYCLEWAKQKRIEIWKKVVVCLEGNLLTIFFEMFLHFCLSSEKFWLEDRHFKKWQKINEPPENKYSSVPFYDLTQHVHPHTHSLSRSLSHTNSHTHSHSHTLSFTHLFTHTHAHSL